VTLNVAVLANLKKNAPDGPGAGVDAWSELDSETTTDAIVAAIERAGHRAAFLEGNLSLVERLSALKPDICFNICEGHWGDSRESHVPAILEMLRIPYTGSGVLTLALTLDKPMTKRVLASHQLPTPAFQVFEHADEPIDPDLSFPLFVKPSREGTSMGVHAASVVRDEADLRVRLADLLARYRQPVLVEHFIEGREVTIGIVGNVSRHLAGWVPRAPQPIPSGLHLLPPLEVDFAGYPASEGGVYTHRIKTESWDHYHYFCPATLDPDLLARLQWLAAAAFCATGCVDVARVDFRLDRRNGDEPFILEINALPGLSPGYSDLALAAAAGGMNYDRLIQAILDAAVARHGLR
jgi:D-alanine-D-alanine ligase